MNAATVALILKVVDGALLIYQRYAAAQAELESLAAELRVMVAAGRDPTPEEWAAVRARTNLLQSRIAARLQEP